MLVTKSEASVALKGLQQVLEAAHPYPQQAPHTLNYLEKQGRTLLQALLKQAEVPLATPPCVTKDSPMERFS